jgi:hypothetical protein
VNRAQDGIERTLVRFVVLGQFAFDCRQGGFSLSVGQVYRGLQTDLAGAQGGTLPPGLFLGSLQIPLRFSQVAPLIGDGGAPRQVVELLLTAVDLFVQCQGLFQAALVRCCRCYRSFRLLVNGIFFCYNNDRFL